MSIGISPSFPEPVEIIQNSDGKDYHSFRIEPHSMCGKYETEVMNCAWTDPKLLPETHPFMIVSGFSRSAKGCRTKNDFIEAAASYLMISKDAVRNSLKAISDLETNSPESPVTYVCCFILNRFAAISWAKSAIPKDCIMRGSSVVMLDGKLSSEKRKFIISHL
jgi:hypothetical protein